MNRCHRCNVEITLRVVGSDYCAPCRRDIKVREEQDAKRAVRFSRFGFGKDLSGSAA